MARLNWGAFFKVISAAAVNAALGYIVAHASGNPAVGVGTMALGTAIAHGATSPFEK